MLARFTDVSSTRNSNGTVGIAAKKSGVLADRSPSGRQRSDFYELPDLNHFLRPAAVPVIAIPFALRYRHRVRTVSSADQRYQSVGT